MTFSIWMHAGEAFAKTAILISRSCQPTFPAALGYEGGPASHTHPNQLFDHILEARDTLQDSALYDIVLCSSIAQLASRYVLATCMVDRHGLK